ncbi:alpha-methylacyl-CoA racemase [alpha proteobacterium U9-1i]|nr:alpha-methylacyl-CoA racemase [alpha proteobacterium U9-1i]
MGVGRRQGPLLGLKVVEFGGIGPGPFCGMLLSDLGADVIRIDRKGAADPNPTDVLERGRRSVAFDLKRPEAVEACLRLIENADALFEGFRPGVMERLGLGPDVALKRNPKLVYGRMTGWGQTGPLAHAAGHDMNYIAITGALHAVGMPEKPMAPLALAGDLGGGGLYLALGLLAAIIHARQTGQGQVVDAAIVDGAASLMGAFYGSLAGGRWKDERGVNVLDGAAPFYDTYQCSDGKWISIAPLEPHFYTLLLDKAEINSTDLPDQYSRADWPAMKQTFAAIFAQRTREEWCALLEGADVCFAPVLSMTEAPTYPPNVARGVFVAANGFTQPAPAPRFSLTPGAIQGPPVARGAHTEDALREWGFAAEEINALRAHGAA